MVKLKSILCVLFSSISQSTTGMLTLGPVAKTDTIIAFFGAGQFHSQLSLFFG